MTRADRLAHLKPVPAKATVPPRAIGYRRLSKLEPKSLGLDAQLRAIEATATRLKLPLDQVFTDADVSGGLEFEQRLSASLQLVSAVAALGKGDVLIVAKRDRLGRNVLTVAMIARLAQRKGARIVSAAGEGTDADDPTQRLMAQLIDSFAEYERALIRQRTKAALAVKKERGERVGNIEFGYRLSPDGRTLEPWPKEQTALSIIRDMRALGCSYQAIADELTAQGILTRGGHPWPRQLVHRVFRADSLIG
jgi:DNA invertase Pin-like site-specific DNA recombinase